MARGKGEFLDRQGRIISIDVPIPEGWRSIIRAEAAARGVSMAQIVREKLEGAFDTRSAA